jgi:hypothetical protein
MFAETEPVTVEQALKEKHWKEAMIDELKSIEMCWVHLMS